MLTELPSDMNGVSKTPASGHLFNMNPASKKLLEDKAQLFHHLVAKLLYLCRCIRQYIQTAVAFLCTWVKELDEDDYKKLDKVMQYIRGIRELMLSIEPRKDPKSCVDSLYTVYPDMWSHTGVDISLGKGLLTPHQTSKNPNTKSSREAKLVAIEDAMVQVLWTKHFLAAQCECVPTTNIYQNNKSTIMMAENGKQSSSQHTRHLNVRYFLSQTRSKNVK